MNKPKCPEYFDIEFGKKLIEYVGVDTSLIEDYECWYQFSKKFFHLKEKAEKYFEKCLELKEGNVSQAAYLMCYHQISSRTWAEKIIKKCNDSKYAFLMYLDCGSSRDWYENIKSKSE